MNVMAHVLLILVFFLQWLVTPAIKVKKQLGPHFPPSERTTCEQFSKFARFNPYTMLNATWLVFYYWAPPQPTLLFEFTVPSPANYTYLHQRLDNRVTVPVNWTARHVIMWEKDGPLLLVESGDRGQYKLYKPGMKLPPGKKATPEDVRFKQTGDNKVVGFMVCEEDKTFAMTRLEDLPQQSQLQDVAYRLNYRNRGGKSYLYAGNSWMPTPEIDERRFWSRIPQDKYLYH